MNSVSLFGRLASDPETRQVGTSNVTRFRIAVDRGGKTKEADFFTIKCWDKQSDIASKYLRKGDQVGVEGYLRVEEWNKDGQKHSRVEVVVRRLQLVSGGARSAPADPMEDDLLI